MKRVSHLVPVALLATSSMLVACSSGESSNDEPSFESASDALGQVPSTGLSREALKAEVTRIAVENTTRIEPDNLVATRERINPFVADLARIYGTPNVNEELASGLADTWRQLWSDDVRPAPAGAPKQDPERIYQVVTDRGYFYNFSNQVVPTPPGAPKVVVSAFLRGVYAIAANETSLDLEFTRFGILSTPLPDERTLGTLVDRIERGEVGAPTGAGGPPSGAPSGPVGVQGKIRNLYLDRDLRIGLGGTAEQQFNKLYVLARVK